MSAALRAILLLATAIFAQPTQHKLSRAEFDAAFRRGYEAIGAGQLDLGIEIFERLAADRPGLALCPYNLACAYARKSDRDAAFLWLGRAVELGFGNLESQAESLESADADLASLRSDARFAPLVVRMRSLRKEFDDYLASPGVYVPASIEKLAKKPVLVVLHDWGSNKEAVLAGPWRRAADELGVVLVAPSGAVALQGRPIDGMGWFDDEAHYQANPWIHSKPVDAALAIVRRTVGVDRARVFVAGEGVSARVAWVHALSSPGVFRAVIALDPDVLALDLAPRAKEAIAKGLAPRVLLSRAPDESVDSFAARVQAASAKLDALGAQGAVESIEAPADAGASCAAIANTLKKL
jgi:dienelactone hydrolase